MINQDYMMDIENLKNEIYNFIKNNNSKFDSVDIVGKFNDNPTFTMMCLRDLCNSKRIIKNWVTNNYSIEKKD